MSSSYAQRCWPAFALAAVLWGSSARRCEAQGPQRVQLIEKNRQAPLVDEPVVVALEVDATRVASQELRSDERGVLDLSTFQREHQKLFDQYGQRAAWVLLYEAGRTDVAGLKEGPAGLATMRLDLGPIMVSGYFTDEKGQRLNSATAAFSVALRPYLSPSSLGWNQQCRLYSIGQARGVAEPASEASEMVSNGIRFEPDGRFRFFVAKNKSFRFDWLGMRDLVLANPTFAVAEADVALKLIVKPKPFCLYGDLLDAASGKPVTESININGPGVSFFGSGQSKYALFFDKPQSAELKIGASVFQRKYREQTVKVDVRQPMQRRDFRLEPLAGSATAIKFRLKINGPALEKSYDVSASLSGENYFVQSGESRGANIYEFSLPQAGRYNLSLYSQKYTFEAPATLQIEKEQTLGVAALAKDTWLQVLVVDETGQPVGFPDSARRTLHEPRVNCVLLETVDAVTVRAGRGEPYLGYGVADVGGALRPDEAGAVKFLLAHGGQFVLRASFVGFEDTRTVIDIGAHTSQKVQLRLQARR